ncbi:Hypothetical predicted protein [Pelobates cultripes]|uniref:Uncharacterized protein n=1 Tax=Pelobates cultripes TaxID=61616 RepID=A0AAD1R206_PELCU|nr:Hypothetical predicted protein [Pelobates cultripes]
MLWTAILKYIWKGDRARIGHEKLCLPKTCGGLALPDLNKYYHATIVQCIRELHTATPHKRWITLCKDLAENQLHQFLWHKEDEASKNLGEDFPITQTLKSLTRLRKVPHISPTPSPLIPITINSKRPRWEQTHTGDETMQGPDNGQVERAKT